MYVSIYISNDLTEDLIRESDTTGKTLEELCLKYIKTGYQYKALNKKMIEIGTPLFLSFMAQSFASNPERYLSSFITAQK